LPGRLLPGRLLPGRNLPGDICPEIHLPGRLLPGRNLPQIHLPGLMSSGQMSSGQMSPDKCLPGKCLPGKCHRTLCLISLSERLHTFRPVIITQSMKTHSLLRKNATVSIWKAFRFKRPYTNIYKIDNFEIFRNYLGKNQYLPFVNNYETCDG
jgi:hypothetical protein